MPTSIPENNLPDGFEQQLSRYVVGIDLGTTNCAVGYIDTQGDRSIQVFRIPQWIDLGVQQPLELLPSFHYQPLPEERARLNDAAAIVGAFARDRGGELPGRLIASAKSWLCHAGVDRTSPILPWHNDSGVEKLSPVAASSAYLQAIRVAWDHRFPDHPLAQQEIVLTLPASFDQVARQLTIDAAKQAGLNRVMPIEEPQAAFYAWLAKHEQDWESQIKAGQTILVCDIGGGTTDFTLIRVRESAKADATDAVNQLHQQRLTLHRVAVGQHLILGGDNIDLALARLAESKLTGGKSLPSRSWDALLSSCRSAKELLLSQQPPETYTIHLPGMGSRLIGGGNQVELTIGDVQHAVIEGFFPDCSLATRPQRQSTGFQEFGLPYATDAAITHHLAAFLWDHRHAGRTDDEAAALSDLALGKPDWVLFNGGVLTSQSIVDRIVHSISTWFRELPDHDDWRPGVLSGERLDLAVAFGAAYFGRVRRGSGVEIEAKLACSYYLQVQVDPPEAVCIVPGSASPGDHFQLSQPMELAIGQPVQFPILFSSTRLADNIGQHVPVTPEEFAGLPPIRTVLNSSRRKRKELLPVKLQVELSQIGTLQMWCQAADADERWQLEFDIRGSTQTDHEDRVTSAAAAGILDSAAEREVRLVLERTFGDAEPNIRSSKVINELSQALSMSRNQWPPQLLRSMWQTLMEFSDGRKKSPELEARWLNLVGHALRPGFGMAADDWRVAETWRSVHGKLNFAAASSRNEALILWRRIAGGFTAGQQLTVYQQIAGPLRQVLDPSKRSKGPAVTPHELIELLRLAGALELLPKLDKTQLGGWAIDLLKSKKFPNCQSALCWCVARLGARQPSYGPLNCVVDVADVEAWIDRLLKLKIEEPTYCLALMQCARRVGDRYRDVSEDVRASVLKRLELLSAAPHYLQLVREGGSLADEEASEILGDSLPLGLQLRFG